MRLFRIFLVAVFLVITGYTLIVGSDHGWNLAPLFFAEIAKYNWQGQFNLDFFCFLLLSCLWLSWRHQFTPGGLVLGFTGLVGGMLFLSIYLLAVSIQAKVNMQEILMGKTRARRHA